VGADEGEEGRDGHGAVGAADRGEQREPDRRPHLRVRRGHAADGARAGRPRQEGHHKEALEAFFKDGWGRVRVNGDIVDLRDALKEGGENPLGLHRYKKHTIEVVVDRIVVRDDARQRLAESIEAALRLGEGSLVVSVNDADDREKWADHTFSRSSPTRTIPRSRSMS
jgi:excinuclease UvrABC ATPase subunit